MSSLHHHTGKLGETMAAPWLQQHGFTIQHSNWRHARYEIDIIATKADVLHFIEVKTRRSLLFGHPEESVSKKKMLCLMNGARAFQRQYPGWKRIQFDILSITLLKDQPPAYFLLEDVYL